MSARDRGSPAVAVGASSVGGGPARAASQSGRVAFVTDKRAYLDRGARDGLVARQKLQLSRGGRVIATCTIESTSDHDATCVGARAQVGDTFRAPGARGATPAPPPTLASVTDQETLARRADAIASSSYDKVEFSGQRKLGTRSGGWVSPGFTVWRSGDGRDWSQERVDGAIAVLDIAGTGMRFDAAFSAQRWGAPVSTDRFRPGTSTQFYLWQAEVSRRTEDANTVFAVGRLWPWHLPGLTLLDGLQLGRQSADKTVEGGVYAGLIPTAIGIAPSTDIWTVGLYGSACEQGAPGSAFRVAREEARIGVWHSSTTGLVSEAEVLAQSWLGPLSLGGGGRLRMVPSVSSGPTAERAFVDVGYRPSLSLVASAHVRYFGQALIEEAPLRAMSPALAGGLHATVDLRWDVVSWLGFAVLAGSNRDRATALAQSYGAIELRLPRCFGDWGGLWLGGEGQEGWIQSRALYLQLFGRIAERLQAMVRATAIDTQFTTPDLRPNVRELDTYASLDSTLASWLRLRAWAFIQLPYMVQGEPPSQTSLGLASGASLTGIF